MTPYLSVVLGIGGHLTDDLLARLSASLRTNYAPDTEVVIVEWNVSLRDFGRVAASIKGNLMPVRIIHAPRELHAQLPNPHGFRYFEMAPKNIGIRRALGEFVLCTNPDDLWSPGLGEFFARQELQHGYFYRVNRYDTRDGKYSASATRQEAMVRATRKSRSKCHHRRGLPLGTKTCCTSMLPATLR